MKKHFQKFRMLLHGRTSFASYASRQAEKAFEEGCYSRSANYRTAMRSFVNAVGNVSLSAVTPETVELYQRYLKARGISQNTASCYNRCLRAIYNRAVSDGLVANRHPFASAFTGKMKTSKRSISRESLVKLRATDLSDSSALESTRDYFMFSFYAMGMPFIDIAYLRKSQIHGDMLVYDRHKTGRNIRVPLGDDALGIIEKYSLCSKVYVFPILTATDEPSAYKEYCTRLNAFNRSLKLLATATGINTRLSSYTNRHSWASMAYRLNVPLHVISQALGHARPDITMTYIRELDDSLMREENEKVQLLVAR